MQLSQQKYNGKVLRHDDILKNKTKKIILNADKIKLQIIKI